MNVIDRIYIILKKDEEYWKADLPKKKNKEREEKFIEERKADLRTGRAELKMQLKIIVKVLSLWMKTMSVSI